MKTRNATLASVIFVLMAACTSFIDDEVVEIEERVYSSRFLVQYFDGCGYLLVENIEGIDDNRLLKPINLPEEFRQEGMSVDVTFRYHFLRGVVCKCSDISIEIERIIETPEGIGTRITGGDPIPITSAPWQVQFSLWGDNWCGGVIIAPNFILTAAHCLRIGSHEFSPSDFRVHAGITCRSEINSSNTFEVYRIIPHPDPRVDAALIQLKGNIPFDDTRRAINYTHGFTQVGTRVSASGWGQTEQGHNRPTPDCLHAVYLHIISNQDVRRSGFYRDLFEHEIAATGSGPIRQGVCFGDSGGPLVVPSTSGNETLVGIAAFTREGCLGNNATSPSVFTRVSSLLDWILPHVGVVINGPSVIPPNATATFTVPNLPQGMAILWSSSDNLRRTSPSIPVGYIAIFENVDPFVREGWVQATLLGPNNAILRHNVQIGNDDVVIKGTRWATRNVNTPGTFVALPQNHGRLYQWGTLNGVTHHWDNSTPGTPIGWNNSAVRTPWTATNNPCPTGWRLPTEQELRNLGTGTWTANWNNTGVAGLVFGTAPNQIFLPAAGSRQPDGNILFQAGTAADYWGSTPGTGSVLLSSHIVVGVSSGWNHAFARSIRCVRE